MSNHDIMRGVFEIIENRLTPTVLDVEGKPHVSKRTDPIAVAHAAMIRELARMHVPKYSNYQPEPEDHEDVADYILRLAAIWDLHLLAVGQEVKSNALCVVDLDDFTNKCHEAVEGYSTHQADEAAQAAREQQDEGDDSDRYWEEMQASDL